MDNVLAAVEAALLDLLGKHLGVPVCELLGSGRRRDSVRMLAYLFLHRRPRPHGLPYLAKSEGGKHPWYRARHEAALTPAAIVAQAEAAVERYGFRDFKLKGGVMAGEEEMEAVTAIKRRFPEGRVTLDPNGAWPLAEAIALCPGAATCSPMPRTRVGPEEGYSGREVMAEFRRATGVPTATNMVATDWRQMAHSHLLGAVDIPLADPHFWTLQGSCASRSCARHGASPGARIPTTTSTSRSRCSRIALPPRRKDHRHRHALDLAGGPRAPHARAAGDRRRRGGGPRPAGPRCRARYGAHRARA
jgi:glucarate dehydratase